MHVVHSVRRRVTGQRLETTTDHCKVGGGGRLFNCGGACVCVCENSRRTLLGGQPPVTSATVHFGNHMGQSLPAKQRAEDRPGFIMADISLGLEAVPVCVVNTFDKRSPHWAGTSTHPLTPQVMGSLKSTLSF